MSDEHHHYIGALFVQFSDDEVWESHVWPPERWRHVTVRREDIRIEERIAIARYIVAESKKEFDERITYIEEHHPEDL